ncbi:MAG: histidine kinase [Burkholderiaceae bacterium]|nr:histidine kinase [Burkholderiaceae bacterium]
MNTEHVLNKASDQLLPSEVSLQTGSWVSRYRNFPIFSRSWQHFRCRTMLGFQLFGFTLFTLLYLLTFQDWQAYLVIAIPINVGIFSLYTVGPQLAVYIRQKNLTVRKEAWYLIAAIAFGLALSYGLFEGLRFTSKLIAYGDGNVRITVTEGKPIQVEKAKAGNSAEKNIFTHKKQFGDESTSADEQDSSARTMLIAALKTLLNYGPLIYLFLYLGGVVDLWFFFRQRKKLAEALVQQALAQAQNAQREAELRLAVLAAQVEPHFLFNTLAGVRSAIQTEPHRAVSIVDHLVDYLRATIPQMRDDGAAVQARLARQLEAARSYLGLMQARLPRLSFAIESDIADAALPALMLISLVENAVKHGVEPKIGAVYISVTAKLESLAGESKLVVSVMDNGAGFAEVSSGSGIGLANIRARLDSLYGARAWLSLKARSDGGINATIVLPYSV